MAGRPTDLCPEVQKVICECLEEGLPRVTAAGCAGIHQTTYDRWLRDGDADLTAGRDTDKARFRLAVEKALCVGIRELCRTVKAGKNGWQGSAWMLERVHFELFGRRLPPEEKEAADRIEKTLATIMEAERARKGRKSA